MSEAASNSIYLDFQEPDLPTTYICRALSFVFIQNTFF